LPLLPSNALARVGSSRETTTFSQLILRGRIEEQLFFLLKFKLKAIRKIVVDYFKIR